MQLVWVNDTAINAPPESLRTWHRMVVGAALSLIASIVYQTIYRGAVYEGDFKLQLSTGRER